MKVALPVSVPACVTAALRPGEVALFDADANKWFASKGDGRRALGLHNKPSLLKGEPNGIMQMPSTDDGDTIRLGSFTFPDHDLRIPLRSLNDHGSANMSPANHRLLDEMRRFYERGGAT